MLTLQRQEEIMNILRQKKSVTVPEVVSKETDIDSLSSKYTSLR